LRGVSGADLGDRSEAWQAWLVDQEGHRLLGQRFSRDKPVIVENVPIGYEPQAPSMDQFVGQFRLNRVSCFGAGTIVRTLNGPRAIETLQIGDRVLTMETKSGALGYQPITAVHHNPPSPTFLVKVSGDTIVSSPFHRFWVVGRGWVMARDLKGGEVLRLLDGPSAVESVSQGPEQPVYNLDVAGAHDFFAGSAAALVHDNTLPDARLRPFDAPAEVAAR
ncbi:MAG: HINT domain-containing protein, partial [Thermoleophilia bacterium]|nr:HINT domain-containing protein [Thermoleophilia bacterium]